MQPARPLTPQKGNYSDAELRCIMATLVDADPEQVCEVAAVVIFHSDSGVHSLRVITDQEDAAKRAGVTLAHAALHVMGRCKRCRKARRKLGLADPDGG